MSRGRHRRPRTLTGTLTGLWALYLLHQYNRRCARRARQPLSTPPATIRPVALTMADVIHAATTAYPATQPCPWGYSAGACARWHPADHADQHALNGAGAPVAQ